MMTINIQFFNSYLISVAEKYELVELALGSKCLFPSVFESFFENDAGEISNNVQLNLENSEIRIKSYVRISRLI